jgi:hypothetical protein
MFGLFGFDPTGMSDEELMQKSMDLHTRLVWANRFGGAEIITRLQELLAQVEFERQERVIRFIVTERNNMFPDVIESDPELASAGKEQEPVAKGKIVPAARPKPMITRSNRPVEENHTFGSNPADKKKDANDSDRP